MPGEGRRFARTVPSSLRIRVRVTGNMRRRRWFRSLHVPCFSDTPEPVNVPGGARRLPPGYPGSRQRKSPLRGALGLFPPAIGSGVILHPCRSRPLGASMRLAPACGQRLSDFQPDQGVAVIILLIWVFFVALQFFARRFPEMIL